MQEKVRHLVCGVMVGILALGLAGTTTLASALKAQDDYDRCVDEPLLSLFDGNDDGILSLKELQDLARRYPNNARLRALAEQANADNLRGIRYDGRCDAVGQGGASAVGQDGASAVGQDGQSAVGGAGGSAVGGAGGSAVGGAAVGGDGGSAVGGDGGSAVGGDGQRVPGEPGEYAAGERGQSAGREVCAPSPQLALADADRDGVVSIEEIDMVIDLVGGNAELENLRDEIVDEGIVGIRYRECEAGTPSASPVPATPVATPGATPPAAMADAASGSAGAGSDDVRGDGEGDVDRSLLFAGTGGAALLGGAFILRMGRRP